MMRNKLALCFILIRLCIAGIQLQNGEKSQIYYIHFYLQGVDGNPSCGDSINNVQIWSNTFQQWETYTQVSYNTGNGDLYGFACDNIPGCEYDLPVSVLLSTVQGNPITLTDIINNYSQGSIFYSTCQLCQGREWCYGPTPSPTKATQSPTKPPTKSPTKPPTYPTKSPTTPPTNAPSISPTESTNSPTNSPTKRQPSNNSQSVTYVDIQYTILCIIVIIVISIIFGSTCYKFYKTHTNITISKSIQYSATIAMFSFLLCYFSWLLSIFSSYHIFEIIEYTAFAMGWLSLYLFMFYRLYHTFKDSVYKMSAKHIYFHVVVVIFIPIWFCIQYSNKIYDDINIYLSLSAIGSILTLVGLLALIISFNKNLFSLVLMQNVVLSRNSNIGNIQFSDNDDDNDYQYANYDDDDDDDDDAFSVTDDKMFGVITKQTLLGSIMTVGQMFFVLLILILIMAKSNRNNVEWIIYEWFLGIVIIINCLCIFLGFQMNEKQYKLFFKPCHNRLLWWYKLLAIRTRQNNASLLQSAPTEMTIEDDLYIHT